MKLLAFLKSKKISPVKGSALITVIIFAAIFEMLLVGLVQNTNTQTAYIRRSIANQEGLEEVNRLLTLAAYNSIYYADRPGSSYSYPQYFFLKAPTGFFKSILTIPTTTYEISTPLALTFHESAALKVGNFTGPYKVLRKITGSQFSDGWDPHKDQAFLLRELTLFAKSDAVQRAYTKVAALQNRHQRKNIDFTKATGATSYGKCIVEMREVPLIAYRYFSNRSFVLQPDSLELTPEYIGSSTISNISGFLHSNSNVHLKGSGLKIRNPITASVNIFADETVSLKVRHLNQMPIGQAESETFVSNSQGSPLIDSNHTGWRDLSLDLWRGNYLTNVHGVSLLNLRNVRLEREYDEEAQAPNTLNEGAEADDDNNSGWILLKPTQELDSTLEAKYPDDFAKMSANAGLIIILKDSGQGNTRRLKNSKGDYTKYYLDFLTYSYHVDNNPYAPASSPVALSLNTNTFDKIFRMHEYIGEGDADSFFDQARNKAINLLDIDVGKLNLLFPSASNSPLTPYTPGSDYNGVIYVYIPETTAL
jgi:hypothetical protein